MEQTPARRNRRDSRVERALRWRPGMNKTLLLPALSLSLALAAPAASAQFLVGPRVAVTVPVPGGAPELGGALDMRVSNPTRMIQFGVSLQGSLDGERGVFAADFGVSWFLGASERWVPYAGGGLQLRAMFFDGTTVMSAAVQAQLGVMSARAGRRRLFAELRLTQNVLPFSAQDSLTRQSVATPGEAWRFEPSANVGFLF